MKVIFDHLDRSVFIASIYQVLADALEHRTKKNIEPLSLDQLYSIKDNDEIKSVNGVRLGLKFKGNYVEFDDEASGIYMNILYKMKITNPYFINKMKEDFIIEFEYNSYVKEINEIEEHIDECKLVMKMLLNHAIKMKKEVENFPNDVNKFLIPLRDLETSKNKLDNSINSLLNLRESKIKDVFELEGYPCDNLVK